MDKHSEEELRVYSLLQKLEEKKYHENELKKIFGYKCPLNTTRLYKYIHLEIPNMQNRLFTILKGELVTGDDVSGREPILRGKYKITALIDGVPFVYVKKGSE
ncbi:MAG: hypothetical protein GOV02_03135 [Candidatus Aenigmarchaeota archaeon]|nr:hypothetical protein [Candidatus Aenigmarchaeota archaeon]